MIQVDDQSPRWLKELARFLPLKSLIFLDGNILDLVSFPVARADGTVYWTDDSLSGFLKRYLTERGYRVVGFVDPVDGLSFPDKRMEDLYRDLRRGRKPKETTEEKPPEGAREEAGQPDEKEGERREDPGPPPAGTAVDFNNILQGLRASVRNQDVPCAFVFDLASRLVGSPGHLVRDERSLLTKVLKASMECRDVFGADGQFLKNLLILLCDKINDLPPFLYVGNPRARTIRLDMPDSLDRTRFINRLYGAFHGADGQAPPPDLAGRFSALTEGLTQYELMSLVHLSRGEAIDVGNVENLLQRYKYGVRESEWDKLDQTRLAGAEKLLRARVKGQDQAIARVLDIIKRARVGLAAGQTHTGGRPRGVLFFAGPTGVGKTEMAKSLAELLFGEEDRCIRFDMSEYTAPQSDEKLLGAPPGYLGYEEGGQLTNALKRKPFAILLFDEIEKAHGAIFDKFLQILDDGRLTDGKGETVYFSEAIIIFTSNLGTVARDDAYGGRRALVNPGQPYAEMRESILESIRDHFNFVLGRPEILNRFGDNFVVFDFIKPPVDEDILRMMLSRLDQATMARWKLDLEYAPPVIERLIGLCRQRLHHGGRGVRNVVDTALVNPLTRFLFDLAGEAGRGIPEGSKLVLTDLLDHGPDAPYQFEILGELAGGEPAGAPGFA